MACQVKDSVERDKHNTRKFENPVHPDSADPVIDQRVYIVEANGPHQHEGKYGGQSGQRKCVAPECPADHPEQEECGKYHHRDQTQDHGDLESAPVVVPAVCFCTASRDRSSKRLKVKLLIHRQDREDENKKRPEKPLSGRMAWQFKPRRQSKRTGCCVGEYGYPTQYVRVADFRLPSVECALENPLQIRPGDTQEFVHRFGD